MAFHSPKASGNADPVLDDLDLATGKCTFTDGSELQFPKDVKFTDRDLDFTPGKVGVRVEYVAADGKTPMSFVIIKGATKGCMVNAVKRTETGV